MKIEMWPLARIKVYEHNARKISQKAVDKVAASIKEFGFRVPIVVDREGVIATGHTRLQAAYQLALSEAPVHVADNLTPEQIRAYRIMDNRSHEETDWEPRLLTLELADLKALAFDLTLTGFDSRELDVLLRMPDERADDAPPLPACAVTRPGDLWSLGPHRVLCGNATSAKDVGRLLDGRKPFLMVTDPPYGVDYHPEWRSEAGVNKNRAKMGEVSNDDRADWSEAWELFRGPVAYVWHAGRYASTVQASLEAAGFEVRSQIIWAKDRFALSRGHYHWQHEPCWYAVRGTAHWRGDRSQNTLWSIKSREDSGHGHSTQKPVELSRRPMVNHTEKGGEVYDPFLGSGSTLIAAQELERICYGLEIDPRYCDVVCQRFQSFCGKQATLENAHGATFEHVKEGRRLEGEDAIKEELLDMTEKQ
jgi:DNA modification methylase